MRPAYIELSRFKSIGAEPQRVELAPITLLFGPNSAGKSTVLQAFIYLREVLVNRNYDPDRTTIGGDWLDLGGFKNLLHRHDLDEAIKITVGFSLDQDDLPDYLTNHEREILENADIELPESWLAEVSEISISIEVRWSSINQKVIVDAYETSINGSRVARIVSSSGGKQTYIEELDLSHDIFSAYSPLDNQDSENEGFGNSFTGLLNPLYRTKSAYALDVTLEQEKPFSGKSLSELEQLLDGVVAGEPRLLKKSIDELSTRPSRYASQLKNRAELEMAQLSHSAPDIGYIGLINQSDALPNPRECLTFDPSIWMDEMEDEIDSSLLRLLSTRLISSLVSGPLDKVCAWLEDFGYIGPLRDLPARNYQPRFTKDESKWAKGIAAWDMLHYISSKQVDEINYWLGSEGLKTGYQVNVHRYRELSDELPLLNYLDSEMDFDQQLKLKELIEKLPTKTRVSLREEATSLDVMPQDIGVGISQLFPVVVLTVTQKTGLIAIEQPELHIHPAIQVELADLFARHAIEDNKLMLLETHSEHLILRLLRRIRETADGGGTQKIGELTKDKLSVQYVEPRDLGTSFRRLRVTDSGDFLDEWPNGFFDERDEELFF